MTNKNNSSGVSNGKEEHFLDFLHDYNEKYHPDNGSHYPDSNYNLYNS